MFKRLSDAYDYLVDSVIDYANSFRASAKRLRELHGPDQPVKIIAPACPFADVQALPPLEPSRRRSAKTA